MSRPKVLVFIDWYLPGYKAGGPVRSVANIVDHLRHRLDIHIVTTDTDYTESGPYPGVVPDRWSTLPGGEKVWYASRTKIDRRVWRTLLKEHQWDTIYVNGLYSRWFSWVPLLLTKGRRVQRVVAVRGMLAEGAMRHGNLKKRAFLVWARLTGMYHGVRFQATNAEEADDIRRWIDKDAEVRVVPNLPRSAEMVQPVPLAKTAGELKLVSVARIAVEKNTLLAIEALQCVVGKVTLDLYGPVYDQTYWAQCQAAMAQLPENARVLHHGPVPTDEVAGVLAEHHALLMPSAGENFGHTMLEALVHGLPLVISDRTPWRDLQEAGAGWDLSLEDEEAFPAAIQVLVDMDADQYRTMSRAAFALGARTLTDPRPVEQTYQLLRP